MYPLNKEGKLYTRLKARAWRAGGGNYFPLFGACEIASEILCSALGSPVQEIHRYTGVSPEKGHWNARTNHAQGEAERAGIL